MSNTARVLVVDDDGRMAKTIYDILRIKGYTAIEANSGEEAIERVKTDVPDCVLMDIKMSGINGIETLKVLKNMVPDLPVILMSAYATVEQIMEAKQHGAYTVLNKPIDVQAVLSFLSSLRREKNVLIVDDDPKFCRTMGDILESRGYKVETEMCPENVLVDMDQDYKLVVLLDLKLGATNGTEVLKAIRDKYPTKPVILITSYRGEMANSIDKGFQIGAYACLYKPFEIDELVQLIEEIDRKKLQAVLGEKIDI
jgi:two-component system, NtrC family, response regulator HydG